MSSTFCLDVAPQLYALCRQSNRRRKSFYDDVEDVTELVFNGASCVVKDLLEGREILTRPRSRLAKPLMVTVVLATAVLVMACGMFCGLLLFRPGIQYAVSTTFFILYRFFQDQQINVDGLLHMSVASSGNCSLTGTYSISLPVVNPSAFPLQIEMMVIGTYLIPKGAGAIDDYLAVSIINSYQERLDPIKPYSQMFLRFTANADIR